MDDINNACRCGHPRGDHRSDGGACRYDPGYCKCAYYEPCDHDHPRTIVSAGGYGRCGNCGEEFREPSDDEKYGVSNADFL